MEKKKAVLKKCRQRRSGLITLTAAACSLLIVSETYASSLPVYDAASFIQTLLGEDVLIDVPDNWGNNASGRALVSYSPVNDSGAISPSAGTLKLSYFPMQADSESDAFDEYEKNIAELSVTTELSSEDTNAAGVSARKLDYTMSVGANSFTCESVCFAYDNTMYTVEMLQGQQTLYDYFPMYDQVVDSAAIGDEQEKEEIDQEEPEDSGTEDAAAKQEGTDEVITENEQNDLTPAEDNNEAASSLPSDMGTFTYALGNRIYEFPTSVKDLDNDVLQLDRKKILPYDFRSDADMINDRWTEITNTHYYTYQDSQYLEMAGITNMKGYPTPLSQGVLTVLMDTQGNEINITLPGNVRVGDPESAVLRGFPEFEGIQMDGYARLRGDDLMYACNVRDDGCNGYALLKNNAPYYSALSIICDNGVIKEIKFECIGSVRAEPVFELLLTKEKK